MIIIMSYAQMKLPESKLHQYCYSKLTEIILQQCLAIMQLMHLLSVLHYHHECLF